MRQLRDWYNPYGTGACLVLSMLAFIALRSFGPHCVYCAASNHYAQIALAHMPCINNLPTQWGWSSAQPHSEGKSLTKWLRARSTEIWIHMKWVWLERGRIKEANRTWNWLLTWHFDLEIAVWMSFWPRVCRHIIREEIYTLLYRTSGLCWLGERRDGNSQQIDFFCKLRIYFL